MFTVLLQQRPHRPDRFFYLPNSVPAMIYTLQAIHCANAGQQGEFLALQQRYPQG